MDGGSRDGSQAILSREGNHLRWSSGPDHGQADALNKALHESRGTIIGWLNADDAYFDRNVVDRVVSEFARCPDADVVYGHSALANSDGLVLHMNWRPASVPYLLERWNANFFIQPAVFFRRAAIEERFVNSWFQSAMDHELWLYLTNKGAVFHRLDCVLAIDRHQPHRKVITRPDLGNADHARIREEYQLRTVGLPPLLIRGLSALFRLRGISLVPMRGAELAFAGSCNPSWRLLLRQLFHHRARMPLGTVALNTSDVVPDSGVRTDI
jgi:glycosyltransferase involved in cell wall biosynthesis